MAKRIDIIRQNYILRLIDVRSGSGLRRLFAGERAGQRKSVILTSSANAKALKNIHSWVFNATLYSHLA